MKITKAQGRACLREMETGLPQFGAAQAVYALLDESIVYECESHPNGEWRDTLLAMCAAIAGVKP